MVTSQFDEETHPEKPSRLNIRPPVLGTVSTVWTRTTTDDTGPDALSNHEASVILQNQNEQPRRIPIHQDFPGSAGVPKPGDFVRVEYLRSSDDRPVITGYAYNHPDDDGTVRRPPLAQPGHWRRRFNNLYLEAEKVDHSAIDGESPDYDVVRIAKKPDGLSDPTTQIAVDDSGASTQVSIETDGDITISAGGDVVIDEGGTAQSVAVQGHTHDYEDSTGTGSSTKTTGTPNESGTNTEIE